MSLESLFASYTLNGLELPNRIVMAPMTREFSPGGIPGEDVAAYLATFGAIVAEEDAEVEAEVSDESETSSD